MMLDSHHRLLARSWIRMVRLTRLARRVGANEAPSFVVAEVGSVVAEVCQDAGGEFHDGDRWVISVDAAGLAEILAAVLPEGVEGFVNRPAGTVGVMIVDAQDVPAVAILGVELLTLEPGRA